MNIFIILEKVICDEVLTNPERGSVTTTGNSVGDTATYTCKEGYEVTGDATRTCQKDGTWSGTAPTCEGMQTNFRPYLI